MRSQCDIRAMKIGVLRSIQQWSWSSFSAGALLMLSFSVSSWVAASSLYEARIPVANQSTAVRNQTLSVGLHAVLVKVTGNLSFEHPAVQAAMRQPKPYLTEYSYKPVLDDELVEGKYWLQLKYSDRMVDTLVRSSGLPVWGRNRRPVLVWIIVEENGRRDRSSSVSRGAVEMAVRRRAEQRGVPLIFPAMDLKDAVTLSDQDLWGLFSDSIKDASERYHAHHILAGRVTKDKQGRWQSRWNLYLAENMTKINVSGGTPLALGAKVVDQVANEVTALYAVNPSDAETQTSQIEVTNVSSIELLAKCEQYIASLASVKAVHILQLRGEHVVFQLELNSSFDHFIRLINADKRLKSDEGMSDFAGIRQRYTFIP